MGSPIGTTVSSLIDPNNLKIEGFYCQTSDRRQLILVSQDIRDFMPQGIVVNDQSVLVEPSELIRLKRIIQLNFEIIGKQVVTTSDKKMGKVIDYAVDSGSLFIKKLYISQSFFKNPNGGNLGIDRTQIVEITDKKVVVNDPLQKVPAGAHAVA